jgi:hypothetical protein
MTIHDPNIANTINLEKILEGDVKQIPTPVICRGDPDKNGDWK